MKDYPTTMGEGDNKVWNDKLGYMMDVDLNDKVDEEVRSYQGNNKLAEDMDEEELKDCKFQVFDSSIMDAVMAAKDMYLEDGKPLNEVITELVKWLEKCKDKEADLMKTIREDDEDDEMEDEDED